MTESLFEVAEIFSVFEPLKKEIRQQHNKKNGESEAVEEVHSSRYAAANRNAKPATRASFASSIDICVRVHKTSDPENKATKSVLRSTDLGSARYFTRSR